MGLIRTKLACSLFLLMTATAAYAAAFVSVGQIGRAFTTTAVEVDRGGIVQFRNDDRFMHQVFVVSPQFSYESAEQAPGTNVDVRFITPGDFEVRCHIHPKMLLRVSVR